MKLSLTQTLINDITQITITKKDRKRAAMHVLDWIGCASLGSKSAVGEIYQRMLEQAPQGSASPILAKNKHWLDVIGYNAALGNVLEMDDIHRSSILHPGPVVIPVALAMAEQFNASMEQFLEAVIKGYEVTIRLGQSIGRSHYKYFHNTSTCAALGAAMAGASILNLSKQQTADALGNAGSRTGGLWQMRNEKVFTKQWHNSEAAKSGANAAFMASLGLTGPAQILEGPQGIFASMSEDANADAFLQPAARWRIYDCSFKPWPACRHVHPAIDVFMQLQQQHNFKDYDIKTIDVQTYQDANVFCNRLSPSTELEAKFSIQHALAAIALWGEPKLEHYQAIAFNLPAAQQLRDKISVSVDNDIETDYPFHYGAKCIVTLINGEQFECYHQDTLGDPQRPLTGMQISEKASMLLREAGVDNRSKKQLISLHWAEQSNLGLLTQLFK